MVTVGSILGGRGMWIWYLFLSTLHADKKVTEDTQVLLDFISTDAKCDFKLGKIRRWI